MNALIRQILEKGVRLERERALAKHARWKPNDEQWVKILERCVTCKYFPVVYFFLNRKNKPTRETELISFLSSKELLDYDGGFRQTVVQSINCHLERKGCKYRLRRIGPPHLPCPIEEAMFCFFEE